MVTIKSHSLPENGLLRLNQIVGDKRLCIEPIIPVSRSTWYQWVKAGKAPKPVKVGPRTSAYRVTDILALIESMEVSR